MLTREEIIEKLMALKEQKSNTIEYNNLTEQNEAIVLSFFSTANKSHDQNQDKITAAHVQKLIIEHIEILDNKSSNLKSQKKNNKLLSDVIRNNSFLTHIIIQDHVINNDVIHALEK